MRRKLLSFLMDFWFEAIQNSCQNTKISCLSKSFMRWLVFLGGGLLGWEDQSVSSIKSYAASDLRSH
jgi:hypothetical protein